MPTDCFLVVSLIKTFCKNDYRNPIYHSFCFTPRGSSLPSWVSFILFLFLQWGRPRRFTQDQRGSSFPFLHLSFSQWVLHNQASHSYFTFCSSFTRLKSTHLSNYVSTWKSLLNFFLETERNTTLFWDLTIRNIYNYRNTVYY